MVRLFFIFFSLNVWFNEPPKSLIRLIHEDLSNVVEYIKHCHFSLKEKGKKPKDGKQTIIHGTRDLLKGKGQALFKLRI